MDNCVCKLYDKLDCAYKAMDKLICLKLDTQEDKDKVNSVIQELLNNWEAITKKYREQNGGSDV